MILHLLGFLLFKNVYSRSILDSYVAPAVDNQKAPLVAMFDLRNISLQIVKSMEEPLRKFINDAIDEKVNEVVKSKLDQYSQKIGERLTNLTDTVVLSSSPFRAKTYVAGENVVFDKIITKHGVGDDILKEFKSSGKFTFEKKGLYQISVFVTTDDHHCGMYIKKNGQRIASVFDAITEYYVTCSAVVVDLFDINDTLIVYAGDNIQVFNKRESGFSVVQLK